MLGWVVVLQRAGEMDEEVRLGRRVSESSLFKPVILARIGSYLLINW